MRQQPTRCPTCDDNSRCGDPWHDSERLALSPAQETLTPAEKLRCLKHYQAGVLAERERIALLAERTQVGMNSLKGFAATIREGPGSSGE